jgi:hypothetical protein
MLPTDPSLLSDYSFVVADVDCAQSCPVSIDFRPVRYWRMIDVNAFTDDLRRLDLINALPVDAFMCCIQTLTTLLNKFENEVYPDFGHARQRAGMTVNIDLRKERIT